MDGPTETEMQPSLPAVGDPILYRDRPARVHAVKADQEYDPTRSIEIRYLDGDGDKEIWLSWSDVSHDIRVLSDAEMEEIESELLIPAKRFNRWFWWPVLALVIFIVFAHLRAEMTRDPDAESAVRVELDSHLVGKVIRFVDKDFSALITPEKLGEIADQIPGFWSEISGDVTDRYRDDLSAKISEIMDPTFLSLHEQVEVFADWNYSTSTSYRLAYEFGKDLVGTGDIELYIQGVLKEMLFDAIEFESALQDDLASIKGFMDGRLSVVSSEISKFATQEIKAQSKETTETDLNQTLGVLEVDWSDVPQMVLHGQLVKPVTTTVAATMVALIVTRIAQNIVVRQVVRATLARLGARAAARSASIGTTTTAVAISTLCGPLAWICAPTAGLIVFAVTWFAADVAITSGDEMINRAGFVEEINGDIRAVRLRIEEQLHDEFMRLFQEGTNQLVQDYQYTLKGQENPGMRTIVPKDML